MPPPGPLEPEESPEEAASWPVEWIVGGVGAAAAAGAGVATSLLLQRRRSKGGTGGGARRQLPEPPV